MNRSDNFDRANNPSSLGAPSDGGPSWQQSPSTGIWGVKAGQVYCPGTTGGYDSARLESGDTDGMAQVTLAVAGAYQGLVLRFIDLGNFYWVGSVPGQGLMLAKLRGGNSQTALGVANVTPVNGDVLAAVLSGPSITVLLNSTPVITASDSDLAGTQHGLFGVATSPTCRWDDYSWTDGGSPPPPPPPPPTDLVLGVIGDSTLALANGYGGRTTPQIIGQMLAKMGGLRSVTVINRAVSGTASGHWTPDTPFYQSARADFLAAGVTHTLDRLGVNDAGAQIPASSYGGNVAATLGDLTAHAITPILSYPTWRGDLSYADAYLQSYLPLLDGFMGGNVLPGDRLAYAYFKAHPEELDGVQGGGGLLLHPGLLGSESDALMQAWAIWKAIYGG